MVALLVLTAPWLIAIALGRRSLPAGPDRRTCHAVHGRVGQAAPGCSLTAEGAPAVARKVARVAAETSGLETRSQFLRSATPTDLVRYGWPPEAGFARREAHIAKTDRY
jgi:hypothetical protein